MRPLFVGSLIFPSRAGNSDRRVLPRQPRGHSITALYICTVVKYILRGKGQMSSFSLALLSVWVARERSLGRSGINV